jgi:hypothetical protein
MLFKVRAPFTVHLERVQEIDKGNGVKLKQLNVQSTFAGNTVDLTPKEAMIHLHKLEPADAQAHKFLAEHHARQDAARRERQADAGPGLVEQVSAAVVAALVAAGVIKPRKGAEVPDAPGA